MVRKENSENIFQMKDYYSSMFRSLKDRAVIVTFFAYTSMCVLAGSKTVDEFVQEFPGSRRQEIDLADFVCSDISEVSAMIPACEKKFLEHRISFGQPPPELQIKCQSQDTVVVSTKALQKNQLVILVNEENQNEFITFNIIDPSDKNITRIKTLYSGKLNKNYTLWSAILDMEGRHSAWRQGPIVQPWEELTQHLEYRVYEVTTEFLLDRYHSGHYVEAKFTWNTSDVSDSCFHVQNTCNKKTQGDFFDKQIMPDQGNSVVVDGLPVNDVCTFLVAGKYGNTSFSYNTPDCHHLPGCEPSPEIIEDIKLYAIEDEDDLWVVEVKWAKPKHDHDYFNVTLRADDVYSTILPGNATGVTFKNVSGEGYYNVTVMSVLGKGRAYTNKRNIFPVRSPSSEGMVMVAAWLSVLLTVVAVASLYAVLLSWKKRQHERIRKQLYYTGILDRSSKWSEVDAGLELAGEDRWEVRAERVALHEIIGAGAFGVVRRGTLAPGAKEVAVKMLKGSGMDPRPTSKNGEVLFEVVRECAATSTYEDGDKVSSTSTPFQPKQDLNTKLASWQILRVVVAPPQVNYFPSAEEVLAFRAEAEMMKSVGAHPHVVGLVACVRGRRPLLLTEYCAKGDLLTYLRSAWDMMVSKRNAISNNNREDVDYKSDKNTKIPDGMVVNRMYDMQGVCDTELTTLDLLSFCRQIAMGMEFLASNRVVHRDLAARNVLVTADRTLKIADFGLSRDVYRENQYKQKGNGKMPVKWMALESLTQRIYTTQSDVWSFGVVMWEVWSVGACPYEAVNGARLPRLLRAGYRMPPPHNCDPQVYELMVACWHENPRSRPTFSALHARLDALLAAAADPYLPLNLHAHAHTHDELARPYTPQPLLSSHRYVTMRMLFRGEKVWSRGRSYERPTHRNNHYTTCPEAIL